jgi:phosphopantothenoylcysteine decarboxylase/phosphopantothenate--cysteine ligase
MTSVRVLLGVTGGIAAYKAAELVRLVQQAGHRVTVIQTRSATNFVGEATFAALTGEPVITGDGLGSPEDDAFDEPTTNDSAVSAMTPGSGTFPHLDAGRDSDVLVIAPATAATIARMAAGIADDVLVATYLAFDGPVLVAPAMNVRMWNHPTTKRALDQLRADGVTVIEPEAGLLACGDVGEGRLAEVTRIASAIELALVPGSDLSGKTIVVTAGGTREPIDAVRSITNRSSGKMGVAIARAARRRGATVRLIVTRTVDPALYFDIDPAAIVDCAKDLAEATREAIIDTDALIMAAAVSDFTVRDGDNANAKLERGEQRTLTLDPVDDILGGIAAARGTKSRPVLVGFSAETGADGVERARDKRAKKGIDAIVFNDVSRTDVGFESDSNEIVILRDGTPDQRVGPAPKSLLAGDVLNTVVELLSSDSQRPVLQ